MAEWSFLLDENIDPKTVTYLQKEGIPAEHVRDALWQGADDEADILPYARDNDHVLVTSDVTDFGDLPPDAAAGVVILYDDTLPAYAITAGLLAMVSEYPGRDAFPGREELDPWV